MDKNNLEELNSDENLRLLPGFHEVSEDSDEYKRHTENQSLAYEERKKQQILISEEKDKMEQTEQTELAIKNASKLVGKKVFVFKDELEREGFTGTLVKMDPIIYGENVFGIELPGAEEIKASAYSTLREVTQYEQVNELKDGGKKTRKKRKYRRKRVNKNRKTKRRRS